MESAVTQLAVGWWWWLPTIHWPLSTAQHPLRVHWWQVWWLRWRLQHFVAAITRAAAAFGPDRLTSRCVFFFVYVSSSISFSVSFSFWALGFSLSSSFGIHDSKPVCRWLPANCRGTSFWPSSDMERPPSQDGARNLANVLKGHPRCRAASSATCCMPALGRLSRTQSSANLAVAELVTWPLGHLAELPS